MTLGCNNEYRDRGTRETVCTRYNYVLTVGLKLHIRIEDESFIGEVYFYDEAKEMLILSSLGLMLRRVLS